MTGLRDLLAAGPLPGAVHALNRRADLGIASELADAGGR